MSLRTQLSLVLFLSLFGLLDSWYISAVSVLNSPLYCAPGLFSCDVVLESSWARLFFDIPNSVLGMGFYGALFLLALLASSGVSLVVLGPDRWLHAIRTLSLLGFLAHLYFVYLQAVVIKAFCLWCLVSAVLITIIFVVVWWPPKIKDRPAVE